MLDAVDIIGTGYRRRRDGDRPGDVALLGQLDEARVVDGLRPRDGQASKQPQDHDEREQPPQRESPPIPVGVAPWAASPAHVEAAPPALFLAVVRHPTIFPPSLACDTG